MKNMPEIPQTEEEQVAKMKQWLGANLSYVIAGIVLGVGGIFSWDYYNNYQQTQAKGARTIYLQIDQDSDLSNNEKDLQTLRSNHSDSIYVAQAQMLLAKHAMEAKKPELAVEHLLGLKNHNNPIIVMLSEIYLAEAYVAIGNTTKAISLLSKQSQSLDTLEADKYLRPIKENLLGDIYYLQGNKSEAKVQYELAKKSGTSSSTELNGLIEIKLNSLK